MSRSPSTAFVVICHAMWNINLYKRHNTHFYARSHLLRDILMFENVVLENVGQGHGVQHWQWCHLIENINVYKSYDLHFFATFLRFRDFNFSNVWPWNLGKDHRVQHSHWYHSVTNPNVYKGRTIHFYASSHSSRFGLFDLENLDQRHGKQHLQISMSIKVRWSSFASSHRFPDISISNCVTLKM